MFVLSLGYPFSHHKTISNIFVSLCNDVPVPLFYVFMQADTKNCWLTEEIVRSTDAKRKMHVALRSETLHKFSFPDVLEFAFILSAWCELFGFGNLVLKCLLGLVIRSLITV